MSATEYKVKLDGCDSQTVITVAIEEQFWPFLNHIAGLLNAKSTCGCEPRMRIWPASMPEPDWDDLEYEKDESA